MFLVMAAFLLAPAASACSCVNTSTPCSALAGKGGSVFIGRALTDTGEGWGTGPARMAVEQVLRGLPAEAKEVTVSTSAGNSCYIRLIQGERYVIFGGPHSESDGRVHVSTFACSNTFPTKGNETLVEALRNSAAGGASRLVGSVSFLSDEIYASGPAMGITVQAISESGTLETTTQPSGDFEFRNVPRGEYRIVLPSYKDGRYSTTAAVNVPEKGCAYTSRQIWPKGIIRGTVTDADGRPLAGVPVQVFGKDRRPADWGSRPLQQAISGADGQYTLENVPEGQFLVGVNGRKYEDENAWHPTFYPNASTVGARGW
ncbi:MAG: carboxypeptidase regulatory-like domain-containing protein [Acidobacteria bacterium]|nr:carboxypeptidase regulatory-like domain-containing protein [Acidobacteriota bacterium]